MAINEPTKCQATNQQGQPCSAAHFRDGWCRWHHPDLVEERKVWSAKGGANKSNKARAKKALPAEPLSTAELHSWLGVVFRRLLTGQAEPGVATAAATVAKAMTELARASDYEERLTDLERRLTGRAS